jgi:integrase
MRNDIHMNMDKIEKHITELSESKNTHMTYRSYLKKYFDYVKQKPEKYLEKDTEEIKQDIKEYLINIRSNTSPSTFALARNVIIGFIETEKNITLFTKRERRKLITLKKTKGILTVDEKLTKPLLRRILAEANLNMRALILTLASSGIRVGEATQIKLQDIDFDSEPTKITIRASYTKTGYKRIVFISDEATKYLRDWLESRESYLKLRKKYSKRFKESVSGDSDRVFPFHPVNAGRKFRRIIEKIGLTKRDPETNRYVYHIHGLRKFFKSNMETKISESIVEYLMGHTGYLSGSYLRYTERELAEFYLEAMDTVTIFESGIPLEKIKELEEGMQIRNGKISYLEQQLEEMQGHWKKTMEELYELKSQGELKPVLPKEKWVELQEKTKKGELKPSGADLEIGMSAEEIKKRREKLKKELGIE